MNLEELQAMTDAELNELSAVKVMGYIVYQNEGCVKQTKTSKSASHSIIWDPTGNMNDAYSLLQSLIPTWTVSIGFNTGGWEVGLWTGVKDGDKFVSSSHNSFPRSITIASILAKEGTE